MSALCSWVDESEDTSLGARFKRALGIGVDMDSLLDMDLFQARALQNSTAVLGRLCPKQISSRTSLCSLTLLGRLRSCSSCVKCPDTDWLQAFQDEEEPDQQKQKQRGQGKVQEQPKKKNIFGW